jgi:hypothetical protein
MFKKYTILFSFLSLIQIVNAQDTFINRLVISSNYRYGFVIPHHSSLVYLIEDHSKAWDINVSLCTKGDKLWQQYYRVPDLGLGFYHADLGNPKYLGKANAVYGFIRIPVINKNRFHVNYLMGGGVAFLTKPFNVESNIYNIAVGSKANAFIDLGLSAELKIIKSLFFSTGLQFTHYSNGAWKVPNLGFNIPSAKAGLKYYLKDNPLPEVKPYKELKSEFKRKYEFWFTYTGGIRENPPPNGRKFYVSAICINAERQFTPRRKFGTGLDIFYDPSLGLRLKNDSIEVNESYNYRSGIHVSHDVIFNNVAFTMQAGVYYYTKETKGDGYIYSRFGFRIKVCKHLATILTLKTHFFKADVIEWGLGYYFEK